MNKVITSWETRWSYANVWEAKAMSEGNRPAWSVSLIIKKDDPCLAKIKDAIKQAYEDGKDVLKGTGKTIPPFEAISSPLNDGDVKRSEDPVYTGAYYINAKNYQNAPGIVDKNRQEIIDRNEVYSGCYGRACISFYAYNKNGNKGIGCMLHHLQKGKDGEHLGNSYVSIEDAFGADEDFLR